MEIHLIIYFIIFGYLFSLSSESQLIQARNAHIPDVLSDVDVQYLAGLSNQTQFEELLDHLLVPRVVGSPNHKKVRRYIVKKLQKLGWKTELDEFNDVAPKFGSLTFKNIIATLNPEAKRFLVLACHYDSKYFSEIEFIGATDSAVPCAMMLNLAFVMKRDLDNIKSNSELSLKLIFFDGEEAFVNWGPNDSIYGAKHLANRWHRTTKSVNNEVVTHLQQIDVLMLLDLLGAPDPKFYCFFEDTKRWYLTIADAEERLGYLGLLDNYILGSSTYFNKLFSYNSIEDDHVPFVQKRVPVLHIIPTPFPPGWHTETDDRSSLDRIAIDNLNKIFRIFVAEYLHLSVTH